MNELESALRARWDRETLRVYADVLQAKGDPRGELIVLDLALAEKGYVHELAMHRRACLREWLGSSGILRRPWHEASFRDGFASDFHVTFDGKHDAGEYVEALFESPAGPYVRGLTIHATRPGELQDAMEVLGRAHRPWLERLHVSLADVETANPLEDLQVSTEVIQRVIVATPCMHTLELAGYLPFARFPHPNVRKLAIASGHLALAQSVPHVDTIDLLFGASDREGNDIGVRTHIIEMLHTMPTLRHLDLARNEPLSPHSRPTTVDAFRLVRWLPDALRTVRLPAFRDRGQVQALSEAIDLARELHVTVARAYRHLEDVWRNVAHERLHLPVPYWWPSRETTSPRQALTIALPTEEYGEDFSLVRLIDLLEEEFDSLPSAARAAWRDFWEVVCDLAWQDHNGNVILRPFPAATLLTAVEPLDDVSPYNGQVGPWTQLAEKLRSADLAPDANVSIRRYWGY